MKKKSICKTFSAACFFMLSVNFIMAETGIEKFFPEIQGFKIKDPLKIYTPENLNSYIKGEAEIYQNYEFRKLAVQTYEKPVNQSLKIEIYQFENADYGFGIYSQERQNGSQNFVNSAGTQGYYESGLFIFYKGCYYVKLKGNNLENDETFITGIAKNLADKLPGENTFPSVYNFFPLSNKFVDSESLVPKNFLGYPFFKMTFTCFYNTPSGGFTFFEMKSNSKSESKDKLTAYFKAINKTDEEIKEGHYTVEDPLFGLIDLIWKGNSIKGVYGPATAEERKEPIEFDYDEFNKMVNIEGNIARNAFASSSSIESPNHKPQFAFDGIYSTRWSTQFRDSQWICLDLGKTYEINRIRLFWESAFGKAYQIYTSTDSIKWNTAYSTENGDGRIDDIMIDPVLARYVRLYCLQRATPWGFSIYEFQVFKGNKKPTQ